MSSWFREKRSCKRGNDDSVSTLVAKICPRGTASGKRSQSIHAPTVCYWQIPAQVLSLIDEEGDEYLRSGHYRVEFGVEGSAEGIPAEAALDMRGDDVRIFAS